MAKLVSLSLCLSLLFIFHGCLAQHQQPLDILPQHQHRLRAKTQCQIQQLQARGPSYTLQSEAGTTVFWDPNCEEFECAGIEFVSHVIQPQGLLLPYYTNAPQLVYIIQGSGIQGTVIPGYAETYESESSSGEEEGGRQSGDRHQKLRRFRQGDILALQNGYTHWAYNDGDTPIVFVALIDVGNDLNQLDFKYRKFFLAGNPQAAQREGERRRGEKEEQQTKNIFSGFDEELLAEAFNIDSQLIGRLKASEDGRGIIVRAEKLRLVIPEYGREEQEKERRRGGGGYQNGLEADVYNPRGGRLTRISGHPSYLGLSAERGILYKNAIMTPHYTTNAHSIVFAIRGSARFQVVGTHGRAVFDDKVNEGQLLVVPQGYVVIKKASEEGFEWITFKTSGEAISTKLAGRLSALREMPTEVLMNSYGISREEARNLKYAREETTLLSPGSRSGRYA